MLEEPEQLPKEGGVFTAATLLRDTSYIERLCKHGVSFQVLSDSG